MGHSFFQHLFPLMLVHSTIEGATTLLVVVASFVCAPFLLNLVSTK